MLAVNRDADAEATVRKALELDPGGASWHNTVAITLLLQGKADAAMRELQQETDELWRAAGMPLVLHALRRPDESDAALAVLTEKHGGYSRISDRRSACLSGRSGLSLRVARACL